MENRQAVENVIKRLETLYEAQEAIKRQIETIENALELPPVAGVPRMEGVTGAQIMPNQVQVARTPTQFKKKRSLPLAARQKIAEAQKRRWAKQKAGQR